MRIEILCFQNWAALSIGKSVPSLFYLQQAENLGFTPEELNIAYTLSVDDPHGPVHWLQNKWFNFIHQVMIKFTDVSKELDIGNLSPEEARQALIERTGDVERAVELSIEERKKRVSNCDIITYLYLYVWYKPDEYVRRSIDGLLSIPRKWKDKSMAAMLVAMNKGG